MPKCVHGKQQQPSARKQQQLIPNFSFAQEQHQQFPLLNLALPNAPPSNHSSGGTISSRAPQWPLFTGKGRHPVHPHPPLPLRIDAAAAVVAPQPLPARALRPPGRPPELLHVGVHWGGLCPRNSVGPADELFKGCSLPPSHPLAQALSHGHRRSYSSRVRISSPQHNHQEHHPGGGA